MNGLFALVFAELVPLNFVKNLPYMGIGMACIFAVIGAIILSVVCLDKISAALERRKNSSDGDAQ